VFIGSLYAGMAVLVARFAGAGDAETVNRVVYQGLLTSLALAAFVMLPLGYLAAPALIDLLHAAPDVRGQALGYLRIMLALGAGNLIVFMLGGALRAAGDSRTPFYLALLLTLLNILFNFVLVTGVGLFPSLGTRGAAIGTVTAGGVTAAIGLWLLFSGRLVVRFTPTMSRAIDWHII